MHSTTSTAGHTFVDDATREPYTAYTGQQRVWQVCACGNVSTRPA